MNYPWTDMLNEMQIQDLNLGTKMLANTKFRK